MKETSAIRSKQWSLVISESTMLTVSENSPSIYGLLQSSRRNSITTSKRFLSQHFLKEPNSVMHDRSLVLQSVCFPAELLALSSQCRFLPESPNRRYLQQNVGWSPLRLVNCSKMLAFRFAVHKQSCSGSSSDISSFLAYVFFYEGKAWKPSRDVGSDVK